MALETSADAIQVDLVKRGGHVKMLSQNLTQHMPKG